MRIQPFHGLDNVQTGIHGTLGIVFMGPRKAKIDEEPITEQLGNMAVVALDDLCCGLLVGAHNFAEVFWIELTGQTGRTDKIAKHHRELTTFGVWRVRKFRRDDWYILRDR